MGLVLLLPLAYKLGSALPAAGLAVAVAAIALTACLVLFTRRCHGDELHVARSLRTAYARSRGGDPTAAAIRSLSAVDLAGAIRRGELSCVAAMEAFLGRARRVQPVLNSLSADRFDAALADAEDADRRLAAWRRKAKGREPLPVFFGVPIVLKECFAVDGMPQTMGLVSRVSQQGGKQGGSPSPFESGPCTAVERVTDAGAICIGVGNTSEACMWMESCKDITHTHCTHTHTLYTHTVHCTLYTVHCTLYTVHGTLYTTVYTHCTMYRFTSTRQVGGPPILHIPSLAFASLPTAT